MRECMLLNGEVARVLSIVSTNPSYQRTCVALLQVCIGGEQFQVTAEFVDGTWKQV